MTYSMVGAGSAGAFWLCVPGAAFCLWFCCPRAHRASSGVSLGSCDSLVACHYGRLSLRCCTIHRTANFR